MLPLTRQPTTSPASTAASPPTAVMPSSPFSLSALPLSSLSDQQLATRPLLTWATIPPTLAASPSTTVPDRMSSVLQFVIAPSFWQAAMPPMKSSPLSWTAVIMPSTWQLSTHAPAGESSCTAAILPAMPATQEEPGHCPLTKTFTRFTFLTTAVSPKVPNKPKQGCSGSACADASCVPRCIPLMQCPIPSKVPAKAYSPRPTGVHSLSERSISALRTMVQPL